MSDTTTPTPELDPKRKRGFIDQRLEDNITLTEDCLREAAKIAIAPVLAAREWTPADQTALTTSLGLCTGYVLRIKELRTGKITRTDEEDDARTDILIGLDPILKGAHRSYAKGSAERKAYGIGESIAGRSTGDLLGLVNYAAAQLSPGPGNTPAKDKLKGVLPAEIAALGPLHDKYKYADWAQGDAAQQAEAVLALLKKEIAEKLNPMRRDLQGTADQAYTHRDPVNAPQRKAFGLQPDRPLVD